MLSAACLIGTVLLTSRLADSPALAVYALSFWHYLFYWWAYRHGVVQPARFRGDAILMKSVALMALASAYLTQPWHWIPALAIVAGFMLNLVAARALGQARTYYGWELGELAPERVTSFPYSVVPHPMLVGNMMAFGATLLNPGFREAWWPLAVIHVSLNAALIVMETSVTPARQTRRRRRRPGSVPASTVGVALAAFAVFATLAVLAAGAAAVFEWPEWPAGWAPVAIVAGASAAYAYVQRGWYVSAASAASDASAASPDAPRNHSRSQEVV
jgi:protein-S-isoprenylcysteine O-methyltransferase Ste14